MLAGWLRLPGLQGLASISTQASSKRSQRLAHPTLTVSRSLSTHLDSGKQGSIYSANTVHNKSSRQTIFFVILLKACNKLQSPRGILRYDPPPLLKRNLQGLENQEEPQSIHLIAASSKPSSAHLPSTS